MKIQEILTFLQDEKIPYTFVGDPSAQVEGFSSLQHYKPGSFTWIKSQKNISGDIDLSTLALAFVSEGVDADTLPNAIYTPESKHAFFATMEHFYDKRDDRPAIGQFTYIAPTVKLGKNVRIGHNCTLDGDITIGDDTVIWNHVTIMNRVSIGRRCEICSGVIIGHDGFAYTEDDEGHKTMVKSFGGVTIGDNVQISMNSLVDRGTIDDTIIESGAKIDCLCMVGHNCHLEEGAVLIEGTLLYGSCRIGKNAYLAGPMVRNQCTIGEGAFVGMGSVVTKDVAPGQSVVGIPAKPFQRKG